MMLPPEDMAQADQNEARAIDLLDYAVKSVQPDIHECEGSVGLMRLATITKEYLENEMRPLDVLAFDVLAEAIRRLAWVTPRVLATAEELWSVPIGTVVRTAVGTIACRYDNTRGVVFGDNRTFPWTALAVPAEMLWHPGGQR